jgi:hypothetical protein
MRLVFCALALSASALVFPASAKADDASDGAKVEGLLKQLGQAYDRKSDTIFVVPMTGKNLGDFRVILATGDGLEVIFVVLAKQARIPDNIDLAKKMLRLNHEFDWVKVEIDDDGDADVRGDVSVRTLDAVELKKNVAQVAAAADEAYGVMLPYLN